MKNKKIFGKKHIVMAGLMVALGAAVWLNMEYSAASGGFIKESSNTDKNLGDTKYVMTENVTETSAAVSDYFTESRNNRKKARNDALALLEERAKSSTADSEAKAEANKKIIQMAKAMEQEAAIETVIKAKGFEDAVVIINEDSAEVIVKAEKLLPSQTLQIQDAVTSTAKISLEKIKIVNRK